MKRFISACGLILGGLLTLSALAADQGPGGFGSGGGRQRGLGGPMLGLLHNERVKAELGLTDEQAEQLRRIFMDARKVNIQTRADLQIQRMELHELMRAERTDREAALKKAEAISALRAQMMRQHVESMLAAKSVLTAEQQKKMRSMIFERMSRRGEGWRGRRGFHRGPIAPGGPDGGPGGYDGPPRLLAPEADSDL